jgi:hypothetical protein
VDVEQIMRDIRARIAQRHGIELSTQQIQELAARRLEAILDPRTINPTLMQQLRHGAGTAVDVTLPAPEPGYTFESTTLYDSHRSLMRFIRRLLNPILKLFFNPNPLVHALHTQARLNLEAAARETERERLQTEWNALHYEILQRLVTEVSRASVEMQALSLRIEALAARVDFNDRRVRSLESPAPAGPSRPHPRPAEQPAAAPAGAPTEAAASPAAAAETSAPEGTRRRRRRRRGRRGGGTPVEAGAAVAVGGSEGLAGPDTADIGEAEEEEEEGEEVGATESTGVVESAEPAAVPDPVAPLLPAAMAEPISPPPDQPTPPPDEPGPPAPAPPDPGPPDR